MIPRHGNRNDHFHGNIIARIIRVVGCIFIGGSRLIRLGAKLLGHNQNNEVMNLITPDPKSSLPNLESLQAYASASPGRISSSAGDCDLRVGSTHAANAIIPALSPV